MHFNLDMEVFKEKTYLLSRKILLLFIVVDAMILLYLAYRDGNQSGAEKDNRLLFREQ